MATARSPFCLVPVARPPVQVGDDGRAARRAGALAARRRRGGGSGTTGGGRRAGPGTGCRGRAPPAWPCRRSWPVTASHSGAAQPVEDGGLQQEGLDRVGLPLQHLLDQVVDDVAVVAAKPAMKPASSSRPCIDSAASWSAAIQPSVRPSSAATSCSGQLQAHHPVEVRRGLVGREAQVGGADLDQLAARPQPGQRQRGIGAAGDHQVQPRRQVVEQERHPLLHLGRVDDVVVVEHQHDVVGDGAEVVEQRGEHRLDRGRLRRLQERERARADLRRHRLQRGDQVGPEGRGLVVAPGRATARRRSARRSARPVPPPATRPAASSCRSRPVRRPASTSTRPRGPGARSAADAAPDRRGDLGT